MPVVYLAVLGAWLATVVGCVALLIVVSSGTAAARVLRQRWRVAFCSHDLEYMRHVAGSTCRRLLHCRKCRSYFEQNIGIPGAPIAPALDEDLPPQARMAARARRTL